MAQDDGAGADDDLDGQPGSGAPGGGSSKDGSENDDALDDKFERRIKAALASQKAHHDREMQSVRAEFDAFKAGATSGKKDDSAQAPKRYTQAELKAAVDANQITTEQSNEIWAKQVKAEATEEAIAAADEHVTRKQAQESIDADLAKYKRLAPEILDSSSKERTEIVARYRKMVKNGLPSTLATELAAIEAVMGPLEKLERARSATRRQEHDEQSGSGGEDGKKLTGNKLVDALDPRKKEHYQKGIAAGRYKDWKEVEAELKYARPRARG